MTLKELVKGLNGNKEYTTADGRTLTDIDNATIIGYTTSNQPKLDAKGQRVIKEGKIQREKVQKAISFSMYDLNNKRSLDGISEISPKSGGK